MTIPVPDRRWALGLVAAFLAVAGVAAYLVLDRLATEEQPAEYLVAITRFGAGADDGISDRRAIQAAIDSVPPGGGTVVVPAGTYHLDGEVVLDRSGLTLRGEGPASVLRLSEGVQRSALVLPRPWSEMAANRDEVVTDVTISGLTVDGNGNMPAPPGQPSFFGVQVVQAERVVMDHLVVRDFAYDGISIGVGGRPTRKITVRNSRLTGIRRNGIHLGFGTDLGVREVLVDDTPSQRWGPAAGNAVDVEVEGVNAFVDGFVVGDSILQRVPNLNQGLGTGTAGTGVAHQPAYGPIRDGRVEGNLIRNHQVGVYFNTGLGGDIRNSVVSGNWIVGDRGSRVSGHGLQVVRTGLASVALEGNVVNALNWCCGVAGVDLLDAPGTNVTGNDLWGGRQGVQSRGDPPVVEDNRWANPSPLLLAEGAAARQSGNRPVELADVDRTPPEARVELDQGARLPCATELEVAAGDAGGVARVFLLVDGIPEGFRDSAPYTFSLDAAVLAPGGHTVAAVAVDRAANVTATPAISVSVGKRSGC